MSFDNMLRLQALGRFMKHVQPCTRCNVAHLTRQFSLACPRLTQQQDQLGVAGHDEGKSKEVESDFSSNPYYSKYAGKLKKMQQQSPGQYEERLAELTETKKPKPPLPSETPEAQPEYTKREGLDSIMKLEHLEDRTPEEITQVWTEYHQGKDFIFAVIPVNQYDVMKEKSALFPSFLLPVPRDHGYEYFLTHFQGPSVYCTPLAAYQAHQENAPSSLQITHYDEFADSKEIVLMRGSFDKNILPTHLAQLLAQQIAHYYGIHSGDRFNLVRLFNQSPNNFDHLDLIKELKVLADTAVKRVASEF